ncbi:27024_t:CDS:2 [Gigaspora margarita]|uniref:27024_t:CDS:1 n=1 Tax=Gigaspora margarita TaxID=4874 RepID=A0ABN7VY93_GIGMA|nr:27024_t:CDS:2 [Gigaspora margarita]
MSIINNFGKRNRSFEVSSEISPEELSLHNDSLEDSSEDSSENGFSREIHSLDACQMTSILLFGSLLGELENINMLKEKKSD